MQVLIVVDMQNDFIDGSLGTREAHALTGRLAAASFDRAGFGRTSRKNVRKRLGQN